MRASWMAVKKLSGVAVPSCSWGSSQRDARPACQARTSLPVGAAPANGIAADTAVITIMPSARWLISVRLFLHYHLVLHIFLTRRSGDHHVVANPELGCSPD